jgi:CheY-like chemotaxis protein
VKTIAVVDDRVVDREYVVEALNDAIVSERLNNEWKVIESDPLVDTDEYATWINDNRIDILIIDERLFESSTSLRMPGYLGSDVVQQLRQTHKKLPILGISADTNTKEFNEKFGLFDDIIVRDKLTQDPVAYLKRFTRKAENFLEDNREDLAELSILSEKIATGDATDEDIQKARSIQEALSIPLTVSSIIKRQEWINEYTRQVEKLETIQQKIEQAIEDTGSH